MKAKTRRRKAKGGGWLSRAFWLGVVPLTSALLAFRVLLPLPVPSDGALGSLTKALNDNPIPVGAVVFVCISAVCTYWRQILPGGKFLEPKVGGGLGWKGPAMAGLAGVLALLVRSEVLGAYRVLSSSMQPTLASGDTLAVNRLAYRGGKVPRRGDVIVFTKPDAAEGELIKRVIGLPGDRVRIKGGNLTINDWEVPHCDVGIYSFVSPDAQMSARLHVEFLGDHTYLTLLGAFTGEVPDDYDVAEGEVFVIGDNRTSSIDSRIWAIRGVSIANISGKASRLLSVAERDDRNSLRHWLSPLGTALHIDDADTSGLAAGIDKCSKTRPANTQPPPPSERHAAR